MIKLLFFVLLALSHVRTETTMKEPVTRPPRMAIELPVRLNRTEGTK